MPVRHPHRIAAIRLFLPEVPLLRPYERAYVTDTAYRPIVAEVRDDDGRCGLGEAVVSTGYTKETPEGAWDFVRTLSARIVGRNADEALAAVASASPDNENAASVLATAVEMLADEDPSPALSVPLLAPVQGEAIEDEVETLLAAGHRTLKFKVGFDPERDLRGLDRVRRAAAGGADIRIDANQGFSRREALRFAAGLDPTGIVLFEQPCAMDDWASNLAVAECSPVPLMLDESIMSPTDIERAGSAPGVGFVKLKLKKTVTRHALGAGLDRIRALGMEPVMGDGVACDICCWHEGLVASDRLANAGEMNGYLKPAERFLEEPLGFAGGRLTAPEGYRPKLDEKALRRLAAASEIIRA